MIGVGTSGQSNEERFADDSDPDADDDENYALRADFTYSSGLAGRREDAGQAKTAQIISAVDPDQTQMGTHKNGGSHMSTATIGVAEAVPLWQGMRLSLCSSFHSSKSGDVRGRLAWRA